MFVCSFGLSIVFVSLPNRRNFWMSIGVTKRSAISADKIPATDSMPICTKESPSDVVYTAKLAQITTLVKTIGVPMVWNERRIAFL